MGSASVVLPSGHKVSILVAVNPHGSPLVPNSKQFCAAPFEVDNELGGLGVCTNTESLYEPSNGKSNSYNTTSNTTIVIVATDSVVDKSQAKRLTVAAQDVLSRSIVPSRTLFDGDIIFGVHTLMKPLADADSLVLQIALGDAASICMTRAVARGV